MTYSAGGIIQASDYNNFVVSGSPNLNTIWSVGSNFTGYGQSALSSVAYGSVVGSQEFAALVSTIASAALHQGTNISPIVVPTAGSGIKALVPQLQNNLVAIDAGRLNAAAQGSSYVPTGGTAINSTPWSNQLQIGYTVTFASANALRYYFNSGGQLQFTLSSSSAGDPVNAYLAQLCAAAGTTVHSIPGTGTPAAVTIVGASYNGVTKIGGAGPDSIGTNNGFATLFLNPGTYYTLLTQYNVTTYYSTSTLTISAAYGGGGQLNYRIIIDINDATGSFTVTGQTTSTLTLKPPSTAFLTNTWGAPSVSNIITPT